MRSVVETASERCLELDHVRGWIPCQDCIQQIAQLEIRSAERAATMLERERCAKAVEERFRCNERRLQEKHALHGGIMEQRGQRASAVLIRKAAEIAECRLEAVAAILADSSDPTEDNQR